MNSLGFVEIVNGIEAEIMTEHIGGAIQWADENFDGAWSKALDRFTKAIDACTPRKDWASLKLEGEHYKSTVINLLVQYKQKKQVDDASEFLKSIGVGEF